MSKPRSNPRLKTVFEGGPARSTLLLSGAERQSEFRAVEEKLEEDARAHRLDESRRGRLAA